ncbi:hypothetical protein K1719_014462 [Acacia pycnantha]|nr:hypothetical protein K1719_014462 [Acacia pycnantha]
MDLSDAVEAKSSRLKSVVWNDFDRVKKGDAYMAICKHCKKRLSGSSSSGTSHLRNHLTRCQRRSNHGISQCIAAREKRKEASLVISNISFDQDQKKDDDLHLVNIKFEQEQLKDEIFSNGNKSFDQRRSHLDLARMIILHGYPLTMVEHVGFKVFIKNLQPLFELVTVNSIEADCLELYEKEKQKMNETLDKLPGKISLSADVWMAMGDTEYLSSHTVLEKFNDLVKEVGIQCKKYLILDNQMQWNSTYSMLETALEFRDVLTLLRENDNAYRISLSNVEWERATAVTSYLKYFADVTNVLTRSKYPTANIYFPELCDVKLQLVEWCKNSDECIGGLTLKMRSKFDEYWEKCSLGLAVAAMLDPRFKMKLVEYYYPQIYGSTSAGRIDEVFDGVKALYNEHSICSPLASSHHDQGLAWQVGNGTLCLPGKDSRDRLMGFDKYLHETSQDDDMKSDLEKYLEEPLFPRNVDFSILNWWKVHTPRYPVLSMMARNVLGVPMSKVSPELAYNNNGRELDRDWSSLNPATVQALVCSQDWIQGELES